MSRLLKIKVIIEALCVHRSLFSGRKSRFDRAHCRPLLPHHGMTGIEDQSRYCHINSFGAASIITLNIGAVPHAWEKYFRPEKSPLWTLNFDKLAIKEYLRTHLQDDLKNSP